MTDLSLTLQLMFEPHVLAATDFNGRDPEETVRPFPFRSTNTLAAYVATDPETAGHHAPAND